MFIKSVFPSLASCIVACVLASQSIAYAANETVTSAVYSPPGSGQKSSPIDSDIYSPSTSVHKMIKIFDETLNGKPFQLIAEGYSNLPGHKNQQINRTYWYDKNGYPRMALESETWKEVGKYEYLIRIADSTTHLNKSYSLKSRMAEPRYWVLNQPVTLQWVYSIYKVHAVRSAVGFQNVTTPYSTFKHCLVFQENDTYTNQQLRQWDRKIYDAPAVGYVGDDEVLVYKDGKKFKVHDRVLKVMQNPSQAVWNKFFGSKAQFDSIMGYLPKS